MKGKGVIQFFAIALFLVSIYQLSFNFVTSRVEKRADAYALTRAAGGKSLDSFQGTVRDSVNREYKRNRMAYLDSMQNEDVFNLGFTSFTYQRCKEQQLNLGL